MADSIAIIEIRDIPIAVLKASFIGICLTKIKVSSIIEVIIPLNMASVMIAQTGQEIPVNWKYAMVPKSPTEHPIRHQKVL